MIRFLFILLSLTTAACAPRCHVQQVQWFDFVDGQTLERTVSMTVCRA